MKSQAFTRRSFLPFLALPAISGCVGPRPMAFSPPSPNARVGAGGEQGVPTQIVTERGEDVAPVMLTASWAAVGGSLRGVPMHLELESASFVSGGVIAIDFDSPELLTSAAAKAQAVDRKMNPGYSNSYGLDVTPATTRFTRLVAVTKSVSSGTYQTWLRPRNSDDVYLLVYFDGGCSVSGGDTITSLGTTSYAFEIDSPGMHWLRAYRTGPQSIAVARVSTPTDLIWFAVRTS